MSPNSRRGMALSSFRPGLREIDSPPLHFGGAVGFGAGLGIGPQDRGQYKTTSPSLTGSQRRRLMRPGGNADIVERPVDRSFGGGRVSADSVPTDPCPAS